MGEGARLSVFKDPPEAFKESLLKAAPGLPM
jgi:hypothetical protein